MNNKIKTGIYVALSVIACNAPIGFAYHGVKITKFSDANDYKAFKIKKHNRHKRKQFYKTNKLHEKFRKGIRKGQITRWEAKLYKKRTKHLKMVKKAAISDGRVSRKEQRKINFLKRDQAQLLARIKNNNLKNKVK